MTLAAGFVASFLAARHPIHRSVQETFYGYALDPAKDAYGAAYATVHPPGEKPGVYFINHSPFACVISPNGKLQLRYLFDQLRNTEKVAADIKKLLAGA